MTNLIEAVTSFLKTFVDDDPKPALHVGEVMDTWKYLVFIEEIIVLEQVARNTTTDSVLLELVEEAITLCSAHSDRIKQFMEYEGIPLSSLPEDKAKSDPNAIPPGVKLTDDEAANILSAKLLLAFKEVARSMTEAYRNDVGAMWASFLFEHAKFGSKLKSKMRERGWIKIPPPYIPQGLPKQ